MILNTEVIKNLDGKILSNKNGNKYCEVKIPINSIYNVVFLTTNIPFETNDLSMIFIFKGRNKDISIPIYKGKFVTNSISDVKILDMIKNISKLVIENDIKGFRDWQIKNKNV